MSTETIEFQAEARQLLQLMIHSIYSTKDVFLRELISNSSDALDKLRLAAYRDKDLEVDTSDLHIALETDPAQRTLTVRDNGIGMSRDEVVELIGTIAKSGTAEMLATAAGGPRGRRRRSRRRELIGQFGVGFYSSFMVADRVTLVTRKAGSHAGVRWESDGRGHLHDRRGAGRPAGHRRHPAPQARGHRRRAARLHEPGDGPRDRQALLRLHHLADPDGRRPDGEGEPETVNSRKALWARAQKDVSDEEYTEFYRHVSHDWREPLETIRLSAEGTFEYQALLFLPSHAPMDLFWREAKRGVQLYVKRVFIMDDCEALVPEYLRFVKGVVDAERPVAQHLPRDPPAGPADPADPQAPGQEGAVDGEDDAGEGAGEVRDVLVGAGPGRQGGPALRPRQPAGDPGDLLVRLDARPREADDAARLPRARCPRARTRSTT